MKTDVVLYIIIIILTFFLLRSCNNPVEQYKEVKVEVKVHDTTYIKGKSDTIFLTKTINHISNQKPDTVYLEIEDNQDFGIIDTFNLYETSVEDSLISGVIKSKVKGELFNTDFTYKAKFPKYITRVDTFKIKDSTVVSKVKKSYDLYFGGIIGGSKTSFNLQPSLILNTPKDFQLMFGYGIIDRTYNLGFFTKIHNPFKK